MPIETVSTDSAPKPVGPYSQGVKIGKLLFTSGQLAFDPKTGELVGVTIEEQTRRTLENMKAILQASGYGLQDVVKVTVYLKRISDFPGMNTVYKEFFGDRGPARSTIQAEIVNPKALIEIDAIAGSD
jgi:2-iminobutanoate/2-iminopropanoate deaminase